MSTNFPEALDTFPDDPTLAAENLSTAPHSTLHANLGDSVLALEVKVGINGSANTASIDYIMSHMTEGRLSLSDVTTGNVTSSLHGFAPKAPADATQFLNGATTPAFAAVKDSDLSTSDVTTNNVSTTKHGFAPKAPNDATKFLDGTGAYSTPASGGSPGGSNGDIQFNNAGSFGGAANVTYTTTDPVGNPALILATNTALDLTATAGVQRALLYSGNTLYVGQIDNSIGATYIGYGTSLSLVYGNATNQGPSTVATHWDATGQMTVTSLSATNIPLTVKAAASQSGHLQEWVANDGTVNCAITAGDPNSGLGILLRNDGFGYFKILPGANSIALTLNGTNLISASTTVVQAGGTFQTGPNTDCILTSNADVGGGVPGGNVRVIGGAGVTGNANGRNVTLTPGAKATGGVDGDTILGFDGSVSVGNVSFFGAGSFGGGVQVVFLKTATTAPTSNPVGGGLLYIDPADSKLKYRGSSGTVTTLANP